MVSRSHSSGEGYGNTVVTFLERDDTATLYVAAEILRLPTPSLPRNTRFEMPLPIRFGCIGVEDLAALADAAHVGAMGLTVSSAIRFLTTQDVRVREGTHDDIPMQSTMYARIPYAMPTAVSRRLSAPEGDDGDNELMWSLQLASSWARLDAA
jgi:hypothetical protein